MGAKWKTWSPAFSTRTHTKGLAEITYTPRAPLGPQNESNEKKTFSSHEMRRKKATVEWAKWKVENKQQRQPKVKISTSVEAKWQREWNLPRRKKNI